MFERRYIGLFIILISSFLVIDFFTHPSSIISNNLYWRNSDVYSAKDKRNSSISSIRKATDDDRHNFRRPNQVIADYDPYVAAKMKELSARKAPADDAELVQLARQMIDPPLKQLARLSFGIRSTKQTEAVDALLNKKSGGKFIECGAYDGETASPTRFFERIRGWTGLLVEADPGYYTQILGKQRNVYSIHGCLSPKPYFTEMQFRIAINKNGGGQLGQINRNISYSYLAEPRAVPCFPVETLLIALNWTTVDFFSLDVEGFELPILRTIPWNKYNITTLSVEYEHGPEGRPALIDYMKKQGYNMTEEINFGDNILEVYIHDFIFAKLDNSSVAAKA